MKRTTTNKLGMYQSIASVMNDFQNVWQGVPALVGSMTNFNTKFSLLQASLTEQSIATNGVSAEKRAIISDLRERIVVMQYALRLHATAIKNMPLLSRNSSTKSAVDKLNMPKLAVRSNELKADLEVYGSDLGPYGITPDDISETLSALSNVITVGYSTRKAILKRKGFTESIRELESALDYILRFEMDGLILVFKKTQPAFFNAFRNARVIIDYKHGHGGVAPTERDDGSSV